MLKLAKVLKILLGGREHLGMILGIILGLSFSMSVILATLGIMDGFDDSIKKSLLKVSGDCYIQPMEGYFSNSLGLQRFLQSYPQIKSFEFRIKIQGFYVRPKSARGIEINGIKLKHSDDLIIGDELAKVEKLKVNDSLVLSFAKGKDSSQSSPILKTYKIKKIIHSGIYEKDLRSVYVNVDALQKELSWNDEDKNFYNSIIIYLKDIKLLEEFIQQSKNDFLVRNLLLRPYYYEYGPLLKAVQMEKTSIGLILQVIVLVCIFNFVAFLYYLREKKSKELFLFGALGLEPMYTQLLWPFFGILLLPFCMLGSFLFVQFFQFALDNWSLLKMPGEIYHLGQLKILLTFNSYLFVFGLTSIFILLLTVLLTHSWRKVSILSLLRKEFN